MGRFFTASPSARAKHVLQPTSPNVGEPAPDLIGGRTAVAQQREAVRVGASPFQAIPEAVAIGTNCPLIGWSSANRSDRCHVNDKPAESNKSKAARRSRGRQKEKLPRASGANLRSAAKSRRKPNRRSAGAADDNRTCNLLRCYWKKLQADRLVSARDDADPLPRTLLEHAFHVRPQRIRAEPVRAGRPSGAHPHQENDRPDQWDEANPVPPARAVGVVEPSDRY